MNLYGIFEKGHSKFKASYLSISMYIEQGQVFRNSLMEMSTQVWQSKKEAKKRFLARDCPKETPIN